MMPLDSNIFIQAKNLHHGFDFCPAFWEWLDSSNQIGKVFSIEKVRDELIGGGDDLSDWAKAGGSNFLVSHLEFGACQQLGHGAGFEVGAVNQFLQVAD